MAIVAATASGPGWTDILTAIGTVGAVAAALAIAWWSDRRLRQERTEAKTELDQEHERAAAALADQRAHEKAALEEERAYGRAQLEEERRIAQEREQFAEAYAVRVGFGERCVGDGPSAAYCRPVESDVKQLAAIVMNRGSFTITRVEAQFCLGNNMINHDRYERVTSFGGIPDAIRGDFGQSPDRPLYGVLTPWDYGIRFETDGIHKRDLVGAYPVVRWTDRWGTRWEHKRGVVRRVGETDAWEP